MLSSRARSKPGVAIQMDCFVAALLAMTCESKFGMLSEGLGEHRLGVGQIGPSRH